MIYMQELDVSEKTINAPKGGRISIKWETS